MVLDHPFPPDTRVENEATALAKAGFEVVLLILTPDPRQSLETYEGFTIIRRYVPKKLSNWMRGLAGTLSNDNCRWTAIINSFGCWKNSVLPVLMVDI